MHQGADAAVALSPVAAPKPRGIAGLRAAAHQLVPVAIGVFALPFTAYALHIVLQRGAFAVDFHYAFWPAAHRIVHGLSPYVDPHSPIVAGGAAFVYPAPAALLFAPFGLIGRGAGDVIFTLLNVLALIGALRLLGVRDLRVYGMAFLWAPVFSAWQTANITLLLALGIAAAWRHRDRPYVAGPLIALLVSVKLFLWPLGIWLLATRRYRALAAGVGYGTALNAAAWLVLGTHELSRYSALTRALTHAEERRAYTVMSFLLHHGASRPLAYAVGLSLAGVVALACVVIGRRGNDPTCLLLAVVTCLLATPLVWVHYFALLVVPVAIARPRLTPLWGLPFVMWVCPPTRPLSWQLLVAMTILAAVSIGTARALRDRAAVEGPALVT